MQDCKQDVLMLRPIPWKQMSSSKDFKETNSPSATPLGLQNLPLAPSYPCSLKGMVNQFSVSFDPMLRHLSLQHLLQCEGSGYLQPSTNASHFEISRSKWLPKC